MTVVHQAFAFGPQVFRTDLQNEIIKNEHIHLNILLDLARDTVMHPSPLIEDVLKLLRFDDQWFDISDPEVSHAHEWYLIVLTRYLKYAPSLCSRLENSYLLLTQILPVVGWSDLEVNLLIKGKPLHTLVDSFSFGR